MRSGCNILRIKTLIAGQFDKVSGFSLMQQGLIRKSNSGWPSGSICRSKKESRRLEQKQQTWPGPCHEGCTCCQEPPRLERKEKDQGHGASICGPRENWPNHGCVKNYPIPNLIKIRSRADDQLKKLLNIFGGYASRNSSEVSEASCQPLLCSNLVCDSAACFRYGQLGHSINQKHLSFSLQWNPVLRLNEPSARAASYSTLSVRTQHVRYYRGRQRLDRPRKHSMQEIDCPTSDQPYQPAEVQSFEKDVDEFAQDLHLSERDFGSKLSVRSVDELTLPELSRQACNLVPYVNRSQTLQNLVRLGVNLDIVQTVDGVAELLLRSQFDRDIAPYLHLLHMMGVPAADMGSVITRNPLLLTQSLDDLSARFGYLLHSKFSQGEATSIVLRAPVTLLMDPAKLDSKLGFFQDTFGLTDAEVRQVVLHSPKVIPHRRDMIANVRFHLKEFLAFSNSQLKGLLIKDPKIYMSETGQLTENFEYLYNTMGISRQQLMLWPGILRTRNHIIRGRHLFLQARRQAQYDPTQVNFVSLRAIGAGSDAEFCRTVARCEEREFYNFLKTL